MRRLYRIYNGWELFAECENKEDAFRMWKEMFLNNEWRVWYVDITILLDSKIEYETNSWEFTYYIKGKEIEPEEYIKKGVIEVWSFEIDSLTNLKKLLYINLM